MFPLLQENKLSEKIQNWPHLKVCVAGFGDVGLRSSVDLSELKNATVVKVLLHGIGSNSGSWVLQLEALKGTPALAFDLPGYGYSCDLTNDAPLAADYAQPILAALQLLTNPSCQYVLAGHSLGALVAAAICENQPQKVRRLVLLAPANGFAAAPAAVRIKTREDRLIALSRLGVQGLAQARGHALVAESADSQMRLAGIEQMAQIRERGYTQAVEMLANGNASEAILRAGIDPKAIVVACGDQDAITPPKACLRIADQLGADYQSLGPVGHLVCFEAPELVNKLLA